MRLTKADGALVQKICSSSSARWHLNEASTAPPSGSIRWIDPLASASPCSPVRSGLATPAGASQAPAPCADTT